MGFIIEAQHRLLGNIVRHVRQKKQPVMVESLVDRFGANKTKIKKEVENLPSKVGCIYKEKGWLKSKSQYDCAGCVFHRKRKKACALGLPINQKTADLKAGPRSSYSHHIPHRKSGRE